MQLRRPLIATLAVLAALLLGGCATPAPIPDGTPSPVAENPTPEVTNPAPEPEALVISLTSIQVVNDDGSVSAAADFADGTGTVALLTSLFGAVPGEVDPYFGTTSYDWGTAFVIVNKYDGRARFRIDVPERDGLAVRTTTGITVGSSRAQVLSFSPWDPQYDYDGDGASDYLGLEAVPVEGTVSLTFPGEEGTAYIEVQLEGDTVTRLWTPSDDYHDV
jgi:hypothetical protein